MRAPPPKKAVSRRNVSTSTYVPLPPCAALFVLPPGAALSSSIFRSRCPAQDDTDVVGIFLLVTVITHVPLHPQAATFVFEKRYTAKAAIVAPFVKPDLDLRLAGHCHPHHAVGLGPVRNPVIDEREDRDGFDLVKMAPVDADRFARRHGARPVVARQLDEGFAFIVAERAAKGLDHTLVPVLEFKQDAEIEVDVFRAATKEAALLVGLA